MIMDDRGLLDHWIGGNFSKVSLLFFYVFFFGNLNYDFAGKVELVLVIHWVLLLFSKTLAQKSKWIGVIEYQTENSFKIEK